MKSTHWSIKDNPEDWYDDPAPSPAEAAEQYMEGDSMGDSDDSWYDLRHGFLNLVAHGWIETDKLLDPETAFDGYEPGSKYFAPTGETCQVCVRVTYHAKESNPRVDLDGASPAQAQRVVGCEQSTGETK